MKKDELLSKWWKMFHGFEEDDEYREFMGYVNINTDHMFALVAFLDSVGRTNKLDSYMKNGTIVSKMESAYEAVCDIETRNPNGYEEMINNFIKKIIEYYDILEQVDIRR